MRRADRKTPSTGIPTAPKRPPAAYTAEQRERMQRGLRILARMIVRAHLRRESPMPSLAPPSDGGPGVDLLREPARAFDLPRLPVASGHRFASSPIPQNSLKRNALQGIMFGEFLLDNGLLVHCPRRKSFDHKETGNAGAGQTHGEGQPAGSQPRHRQLRARPPAQARAEADRREPGRVPPHPCGATWNGATPGAPCPPPS